MKRFSFLILFLSAVLRSFASTVDSVNVDVLLLPDGTAQIQERWNIDVSGSITEWYLAMKNLGIMEIKDFQVSENGASFENEGHSWDIERSREAKRNHCGVVDKDGGYELCWGIGTEGYHQFLLEYKLTNLVKSYTDADGFNHMFISRDMKEAPRHVRLSIASPDTLFNENNTKIWAFGYYGTIYFEDGKIVATNSEPFNSSTGLIALVRFEKGIFTPAVSVDESFEGVVNRAMEGSDYDDYVGEYNDDGWKWLLGMVLFFLMIPVLTILFSIYRVWKLRKKLGVSKDVLYERDVDKNWLLVSSFNTVERLSYYSKVSHESIIGAVLLRLMNQGNLTIGYTSKGNGKVGKPCLEIQKQPEKKEDELEYKVFDIIRQAAGEDGLLQEKELKKWTSRHSDVMTSLYKSLTKRASEKYVMDNGAKLMGLKRYLKDFSLLEERHAVEVSLWDEYMVYAQLFGIAKQVRKDFQKICPEYFELSRVAQQIEKVGDGFIGGFAGSIYSQSTNSYARSQAAVRRAGGGGFSSYGGGGGFSGGGGGGGR